LTEKKFWANSKAANEILVYLMARILLPVLADESYSKTILVV